MPSMERDRTMSDKLLVRMPRELKLLIDAEASRECLYGGMGELVVRILARYYGRPELGIVPRKRAGRPLAKQIAPVLSV